MAANRDEMMDRPWDPPARHWYDRPEIIAGRDKLAGGSWLGRNDFGVFATILNREGSLGPSAQKRSRGELVLEALDHADASESVSALSNINPEAYRSFNLVVGDNSNIYHVANRARDNKVTVELFPKGLSMLTSQEINDRRNARIDAFLPKFQDARSPHPQKGDWNDWQKILADDTCNPAVGPSSAMCIKSDWGFGTVSSTLLALPQVGAKVTDGIYLFAAGRPDRTEYDEVQQI